MQCPSCRIAFHTHERGWESFIVRTEGFRVPDWRCSVTACPGCDDLIVKRAKRSTPVDEPEGWYDERVIYPIQPIADPAVVSPEVPENLRDDYIEAFNVLLISAKASAALSRRVLQSMLRERGYTQRSLVDQIEAVLNEVGQDKILPSELRKNIDAVRNFGNFSAHPITDRTSLQIIDVQPEEAEWCLEIIEALFQHYYVVPAASARNLSKLNQKLKKAGKPPVKS